MGHLPVVPAPATSAAVARSRLLLPGVMPRTELPYSTAGSHPLASGFFANLRPSFRAMASLVLAPCNRLVRQGVFLPPLPLLKVTPRSFATVAVLMCRPVRLAMVLATARARAELEATMTDFPVEISPP